MAQQTINVGAAPNDGTGTPLRTAFQYTNSNFSELYTAVGPSGNNIVVPGNATITGDLTVDSSTFKVDSANNRVGIGTASPSQPLHVRLDNAGPTTLALFENRLADFASSAAGQIVVGARNYNYTVLRQNPDIGTTPSIGGSLDTVLANISTLGAGVGKLILATQNTARLSVHETTGDVSIANGNLVMSTSGKGIDFSATAGTGTSELLNDYEEGTFTPTIIGTSTAGTGTYSVQSGTYTKVGRLVSCQIFLNWTAHTGTGDMRISGLPFQVSSASNYFAAAAIGYFSNVSLSAGNIATGYAINATSVITLGQYPTGGGAGAGIAMDTSGEILISVTYIV